MRRVSQVRAQGKNRELGQPGRAPIRFSIIRNRLDLARLTTRVKRRRRRAGKSARLVKFDRVNRKGDAMNIKKILVPFDFSHFSDAALESATALARDFGAELHIVHVKEPFAVYQTDSRFDLHPYGELDDLKNSLEKVVPSDPHVKYRQWLMTGGVIQDILQLADDENIDLIVMGTHGRRGLGRALVGSIAEGVLRRAKCPVEVRSHQ